MKSNIVRLAFDNPSYVLEQILSGRSREHVLDSIHSYLRKAGNEIRGGLIPLDKFVINKVSYIMGFGVLGSCPLAKSPYQSS